MPFLGRTRGRQNSPAQESGSSRPEVEIARRRARADASQIKEQLVAIAQVASRERPSLVTKAEVSALARAGD
jgi:hypothetical protein